MRSLRKGNCKIRKQSKAFRKGLMKKQRNPRYQKRNNRERERVKEIRERKKMRHYITVLRKGLGYV